MFSAFRVPVADFRGRFTKWTRSIICSRRVVFGRRSFFRFRTSAPRTTTAADESVGGGRGPGLPIGGFSLRVAGASGRQAGNTPGESSSHVSVPARPEYPPALRATAAAVPGRPCALRPARARSPRTRFLVPPRPTAAAPAAAAAVAAPAAPNRTTTAVTGRQWCYTVDPRNHARYHTRLSVDAAVAARDRSRRFKPFVRFLFSDTCSRRPPNTQTRIEPDPYRFYCFFNVAGDPPPPSPPPVRTNEQRRTKRR